MDDTFTASDFTSAEASISSEPAAETSTPVESSAPVDTTAQPEGATTPPAVATTDQQQPSTEPAKPAGPIPFDVHTRALENREAKVTERLRAEFEKQYGWATQVPQQEFQQIQQIARHFASGDKFGGFKALLAEAQRDDPQFAAQLRSEAARILASRGQAQQPVEQEPQPDLPIQLEDGRVVHLYSAEQQAKREAFLQQRWLQSVKQEIQPLQQTHEQLQAERAALVQQQQITHFVTSTYEDVKTWPGMDSAENQKAVAEALGQMQINANDPREVSLALNAAYRSKVLPTLHTASRQAVLNDINRQAAASTVNPAQTTTRAPKSMDEMTTAEALRHVAAQMGA